MNFKKGKNPISVLLKDMHLQDQKRRQKISKEHGMKMADAKDKTPYYVFKGECDEQTRIVLFLIKNNFLKEKDDFYYATAIIINSGSLENFILSQKLIKKYRDLGGTKPWFFYDKYFEIQNWGKTKDDVYKEIKKKTGIDPYMLEKKSI